LILYHLSPHTPPPHRKEVLSPLSASLPYTGAFWTYRRLHISFGICLISLVSVSRDRMRTFDCWLLIQSSLRYSPQVRWLDWLEQCCDCSPINLVTLWRLLRSLNAHTILWCFYIKPWNSESSVFRSSSEWHAYNFHIQVCHAEVDYYISPVVGVSVVSLILHYDFLQFSNCNEISHVGAFGTAKAFMAATNLYTEVYPSVFCVLLCILGKSVAHFIFPCTSPVEFCDTISASWFPICPISANVCCVVLSAQFESQKHPIFFGKLFFWLV
jgi:hypothetical protein